MTQPASTHQQTQSGDEALKPTTEVVQPTTGPTDTLQLPPQLQNTDALLALLRNAAGQSK